MFSFQKLLMLEPYKKAFQSVLRAFLYLKVVDFSGQCRELQKEKEVLVVLELP